MEVDGSIELVVIMHGGSFIQKLLFYIVRTFLSRDVGEVVYLIVEN